MLTRDHANPDWRRITTIKSIDGPCPPPLTFRITPGPRLEWLGTPIDNPALAALPVTPDDHLNLDDDYYSALIDAADWLTHRLRNAPVQVPLLLREARAAGHSRRTLKRAKRLLGVRSIRPAHDEPWSWSAQREGEAGEGEAGEGEAGEGEAPAEPRRTSTDARV